MDKLLILAFFSFVTFITCRTNNETTAEWLRITRNDDNLYFVYNRDNPRKPVTILPTAAGAISAQAINNFRANTIVLIHDEGETSESDFNIVLKDAILTEEDVSIVVVEWGSSWPEQFATKIAADQLAEMLRFYIVYTRINPNRLHIIGFGLGAHVAGQAARVLKKLTPTSYEVARITGLDPTGGNAWDSKSNRLTSDDAKYVEVMHTDGTDYGIMDALGHLDSYVNGGINQAGCLIDTDCSHKRAWQLFAASLTHNIVGYHCDGDPPIDANCRGFTVLVGNIKLVKYGSGKFYVESTSDRYPYLGSGKSCPICDDDDDDGSGGGGRKL